jgi:DNA mismatch repair protein MutS2
MSVSPSVNVHFMNLDAALTDVDKYLDDAFIAGLREVSIIHGRGAGILRDGIRRMLKTHPHVTGFRRGEYDEGGDGVTICTLK